MTKKTGLNQIKAYIATASGLMGLITLVALAPDSSWATQPLPDDHSCSGLFSTGLGYVIFPHPAPATFNKYFRNGLLGGEGGTAGDPLLYPVSDPLKFEGRFVDISLRATAAEAGSAIATGYQTLLGAGMLPKPEFDRMYLYMGAGVGSYPLSTFIPSLHQKMVAHTGPEFQKCFWFRGWHTQSFYLPWQSFILPEKNCDRLSNDPKAEADPTHCTIGYNDDHGVYAWPYGFDVDERGYVYRVYAPSRKGHDGRDIYIFSDKEAGHMEFVSQISTLADGVIHLRWHDKHYILGGQADFSDFIHGIQGIQVFDVTQPAHPELAATLKSAELLNATKYSFSQPGLFSGNVAKIMTSEGHFVAVISLAGTLNLYTAEELTKSGTARAPQPARIFEPPAGSSYVAVTTDGVRFYGLLRRSLAYPGGGTFVTPPKTWISLIESATPENLASYGKSADLEVAGSFSGMRVHYGAGFLALHGTNFPLISPNCTDFTNCGLLSSYEQVRFVRIRNGALQEISTNDFFSKHYFRGNLSTPGFEKLVTYSHYSTMMDSVVFETGGEKYIAHANLSVGDVFHFNPDPTPPPPTGPCASPPVDPPADTSPPTCEIRDRVWINGTTRDYQCRSNNAIELTQCKVDGESQWHTCSANMTHDMAPLTEGWHTLEVQSCNVFKNCSPIYKVDFGYDIHKPVVTQCEFDCVTGKARFSMIRNTANEAPIQIGSNVCFSEVSVSRLDTVPDYDPFAPGCGYGVLWFNFDTNNPGNWVQSVSPPRPGKYKISCTPHDEAGNWGGYAVDAEGYIIGSGSILGGGTKVPGQYTCSCKDLPNSAECKKCKEDSSPWYCK